MEPEITKPSVPTTVVQAKVKTNHGFKPIVQKHNRNLIKLRMHPERIDYIRQSLKEYLLIKKNSYLNRRKKVPTEDDIYRCDCISSLHASREDWENKEVSIDCGEGCLNRQMSSECESKSCPCGITCQNRRFQLHQDSSVYPKPTEGKGFGLVAGENIKKGNFVLQYIGEVLSLNAEEGVRRINEYSSSTCTYMMKLNSTEVIDPTYKGNMARFINHSCDPNCETQKWNVLGEIAVGIFAIKDIKEGQELSFNYQFDVYQTPFTRCLCGTEACKGYLGLVPLGYTAEEWNERVDTMPCEACGSNDVEDDDKFLICDQCNNGFHTFCLNPPITKIPEGAWFCDRCRKKEEDKKKMADDSAANVTLQNVIKRTKNMRDSKSGKMKPVRRRRKNEGKKLVLEDLGDYDEIYNLQKQLQREIIQQFGTKDEIKVVDEEEEEEEEEDDDESEDDKMTQEKSDKAKTDKKETKEKKSRFDKIKDQVKKSFEKILKDSKLLSKIKDDAFLEEINKDPNHTRRMISVSSIELLLFQDCIFRRAKKLSVKLFWDRTINKRDFFSKNCEFRISCNEKQYDWFNQLFELMDMATRKYKKTNNFTNATIEVPAIFLKRIVGEYQKNIHHIQSAFQVGVQYDKSYFNDECYPIHVKCKLSLKGIKENIVKAVGYLQKIINELKVERLYMNSSDIRVIIANLMPIKQQIHPSEIRCCRDNALRDINHPFYTIYYRDKEVAFIGTQEELEKSVALVESEIARDKQIKKNVFSLNYLVPVCENYQLKQIKQRIESVYENTELIIYKPTHPRKNISLTLSSNYLNFKSAYEELRDGIDRADLFDDKFERIQQQTVYQMTKYFFKYMQNFFQTKSTIFMKAWDTMTIEFLGPCSTYPSTFTDIKKSYIRDHDFKFYILSVTRMCLNEGYKNISIGKRNIITVCKSILNKIVYSDSSLHSRNYQSIFTFDSKDFTNFLEYYNPSTYFNDYSSQRTSDFELELSKKLCPNEEVSLERTRERRERSRDVDRKRKDSSRKELGKHAFGAAERDKKRGDNSEHDHDRKRRSSKHSYKVYNKDRLSKSSSKRSDRESRDKRFHHKKHHKTFNNKSSSSVGSKSHSPKVSKDPRKGSRHQAGDRDKFVTKSRGRFTERGGYGGNRNYNDKPRRRSSSGSSSTSRSSSGSRNRQSKWRTTQKRSHHHQNFKPGRSHHTHRKSYHHHNKRYRERSRGGSSSGSPRKGKVNVLFKANSSISSDGSKDRKKPEKKISSDPRERSRHAYHHTDKKPHSERRDIYQGGK